MATTLISFRLAWRALRQNLLTSLVAIFTVSLSGGLFLGAWKTKQSVNLAFAQSAGGFDAVLGARGSQLQLVLNALFHIENSPGNLDWEQYLTIRKHAGVSEAYPFALGDNYLGYRIVGTTPDLFLHHQWKSGKNFQVHSPGRIFSETAKEAIVGAQVAEEIGLQLGDRFHPYHGLEYNPDTKHDDVYLVVGILESTGTPVDQVIWIPLKGVQMMDGHDPAAAHAISGVLLNLKGSSGLALDVKYNKQGDQATLAWPVAAILSSFFNRFAWLEHTIAGLALLMALVGGLIILATLRSTMHERRREFAVLRCMGASRAVVTGSILWQSILISLIGALGSLVVFLVLSQAFSSLIRLQMGVSMGFPIFDQVAWFTGGGILILGLLSAWLPARKLYRSSLQDSLNPHG
ncbi:MAG: FtsX-like permease family protein [Opitutae bacterium]